MTLVFCYGSNLDARQMLARCPDARVIGPATLRGWRLAFAGWSEGWQGAVATLRQGRGSVQGVVWDVSDDDLETLDTFEGAPRAYGRGFVDVTGDDGARMRAEAYAQPADRPTGLPSEEYLARIGRAYRVLGFDPRPLVAAVRRAAGPRAWDEWKKHGRASRPGGRQ